MASYSPSLPSYNASPTPSAYSPVFGGIPGAVGVPPSPYQQAAGFAPQLNELTPAVAGVIGSNVSGNLSPDVINAIKNQGAAWGVAGGVPGSDISANKSLSTIGASSQQLQQEGVGQYNQYLTSLGSQQVNPSIQAQIAQWNATMQAAPNPAAAEQYLQQLLQPPVSRTPQNETYHSFGPNGPRITNPAIF